MAAALSTPSLSIWSACRRGDEAYVDEYIRQSTEDSHSHSHGASSSNGGGAAAGRASSSKPQRVKSSGVNASASSTVATAAAATPALVSTLLSSSSSSLSACEDGLAVRDGDGSTPLHTAALFQRRRVLRALLHGGMDGHARDRESCWSALHHALYRGDFCTAALLSQHLGPAALHQPDAGPARLTPLDLVATHVREASAARQARENGSGRAGAGEATSTGSRFVRDSAVALTGRSSAFHALSADDAVESGPPPHNLLYSFGSNSHYTLGYSCAHQQHRARLVDSVAGHSILQVVALRQACFMRDSAGAVWSHGQGASGKLGHEARETLIQPQRVQGALQSHTVTHIAATDEFVAATTNKGSVFVWGHCPFLELAAPGAAAKTNKLQAGSNSPRHRHHSALSTRPLLRLLLPPLLRPLLPLPPKATVCCLVVWIACVLSV